MYGPFFNTPILGLVPPPTNSKHCFVAFHVTWLECCECEGTHGETPHKPTSILRSCSRDVAVLFFNTLNIEIDTDIYIMKAWIYKLSQFRIMINIIITDQTEKLN